MKLKILNFVVISLFAVCLPVLLVTANLAVAVNSPQLYRYGFEKYHVGQTTSLSDGELAKVADGLVHYFNSGEDYINLTVEKDGQPLVLFNERELIHLKDVKELIWLDYRVLLGTLVYALAFAGVSPFIQKTRHWRPLALGLLWGGGLTLALALALGLAAFFDFDRLFLQFHFLSFANDFWQLDPTRDYLIMLFRQGFFYDAALFCTSATAVVAIVLGGLGLGYLIKTREPVTGGQAAFDTK